MLFRKAHPMGDDGVWLNRSRRVIRTHMTPYQVHLLQLTGHGPRRNRHLVKNLQSALNINLT